MAGNGKEFTGTVTSTKMQKTLVVNVSRRFKEGRTGKTVSAQTKYKVHCEDGTVRVGDFITFRESRPFSRDKRFLFLNVLKKGEVAAELAE
jgi:small subunit ribosomal protein S17